MLSPVLIVRLGQAPTDPAERVAWLTAKCRSMRAKGLAGHWTYDKGLHSNLLTVLAAERAALAATEISLASPDQRDLRAAA
jgi:hypothetical protein